MMDDGLMVAEAVFGGVERGRSDRAIFCKETSTTIVKGIVRSLECN